MEQIPVLTALYLARPVAALMEYSVERLHDGPTAQRDVDSTIHCGGAAVHRPSRNSPSHRRDDGLPVSREEDARVQDGPRAEAG